MTEKRCPECDCVLNQKALGSKYWQCRSCKIEWYGWPEYEEDLAFIYRISKKPERTELDPTTCAKLDVAIKSIEKARKQKPKRKSLKALYDEMLERYSRDDRSLPRGATAAPGDDFKRKRIVSGGEVKVRIRRAKQLLDFNLKRVEFGAGGSDPTKKGSNASKSDDEHRANITKWLLITGGHTKASPKEKKNAHSNLWKARKRRSEVYAQAEADYEIITADSYDRTASSTAEMKISDEEWKLLNAWRASDVETRLTVLKYLHNRVAN